jgi:PEP-CTERM motif
MKNRLAMLMLPLALMASPAAASTIQIGSAALLGANDFFDWGQVRRIDGNGNAIAQSSPLNVTSDLGRTASITDGGAFAGLIEGSDWFGNFTTGEGVLYSGDANDPSAAATAFAVNFNVAVRSVGLQITSAAFFDFNAALEVFNGATSLGLFSVSGVMTGMEDGSAPFLGASSDSANITRAVFTLSSNTDFGLGVNRLRTGDAEASGPPVDPGAVVPEPGTLSLVGLGAAAAMTRRRRRVVGGSRRRQP